jgi:hypothetical protein
VALPPLRTLVGPIDVFWFRQPDRIDTDRGPASVTLELEDSLTLYQDIQHMRGEVVVCAVRQDDIDI